MYWLYLENDGFSIMDDDVPGSVSDILIGVFFPLIGLNSPCTIELHDKTLPSHIFDAYSDKVMIKK